MFEKIIFVQKTKYLLKFGVFNNLKAKKLVRANVVGD